MHMTEATWGIRFNEYPDYQRFHKGNKPEGCPEWLESHRISIWQEQGLIIWNNIDRKLESLRGTEALRLLDELNSQNTWKSDGVSVTRLVHQIEIVSPSRKNKGKVIYYQMLKSPRVKMFTKKSCTCRPKQAMN